MMDVWGQYSRALATLLASCGVAVALAACGTNTDTEDSTDSETHWQKQALEACRTSADCEGELECLCGVCSRGCDNQPDSCSTVPQAARCVAESDGLPTTCTDGWSLEQPGICVEECLVDADCKERDAKLNCEHGVCVSDEESRAGSYAQDAPDAGRPYEENVYNCSEGPVECCPDRLDRFVSRYEFTPATAAIPWVVYAGTDSDDAPITVNGTWDGVQELAQPIEIDCPANAAELGLPCEVDYAVAFTTNAGENYEILAGLPENALEAIPQGVSVEVYLGDYNFQVTDASDGSLLLHIAKGRREDLRWTEDYTKLEINYQGFSVKLPDDVSDRDTAICATPSDPCLWVMRVDPLIVNADSRQWLGPEKTLEFSVDQADYRLWHAISYRKGALDGHPAPGCAAALPVRSFFAVVRTAP